MTTKEKANKYAVKHNLHSRKTAELWAITGKRKLDAEIHKYIAASWAWEGRAKRGNNRAAKARYATINSRLAKLFEQRRNLS